MLTSVEVSVRIGRSKTLCSFKYQVLITLLLLVVYWIPMTFCGDYSPEGNFAEKIDQLVLGRFRDGVYWDEDGVWHFSSNYT